MSPEIGRGESPNVATRAIVLIIAGILVLLVLIAFGFQALFHDRIHQTYAVSHPFPGPAVIPNEGAERLALEAKQNGDLSGSRNRMSIDDAMKAIAAKGDHAFDPVGVGP